jgi:hypothetical protein
MFKFADFDALQVLIENLGSFGVLSHRRTRKNHGNNRSSVRYLGNFSTTNSTNYTNKNQKNSLTKRATLRSLPIADDAPRTHFLIRVIRAIRG